GGYPVGIRSRNLVLDGFNLVTALRDLRLSQFGSWSADLADFLMQPVRWLSGRERSDSFVRDDLQPALWECATLGKSLAQKLMRRHGERGDRRGGDSSRGPVAVQESQALN
ncbi:MAG TPA: hypothetical protein VHG92_02585, partial [Afifellaceae bacterium]|nr:hypothetical protein [Afifellaceae bacterium]